MASLPHTRDFDASRFEDLELAQRRFDGVPVAEREGQRFERDRKARAASINKPFGRDVGREIVQEFGEARDFLASAIEFLQIVKARATTVRPG
jgi:hypothetical protein